MAVEALTKSNERTVCLVGNPNTGKSVLFGLLTGTYVTVSNYPGTTVEILSGSASLSGARYRVTDTPGTNSLIPMSEDEQVTRDILLDDPPDIILQVGDAKNLKRVLMMTVQLVEMGLPMVLALNMSDEARIRGIKIDTDLLAERLGLPVISTVAVDRVGLDRIVDEIQTGSAPEDLVKYPDSVEQAVARISALLPSEMASRRAISLMILSGDQSLGRWMHDNVPKEDIRRIEIVHEEVQASSRLPLGQVITRHRTSFVQSLFKQTVVRTQGKEGPIAAFVGRTSMHPIWGVPALVLVLWAMWLFVGVWGSGTLVDFVENGIFNRYINPLAVALFANIPLAPVRDLFVGDYGIITMALTYGIAIVLPIVFTFFIAFGFLEDSGYLPRLAVMVNQIFRGMGLNGKAVLPMVLGLGCDTMATLTTRILESRRERTIVTLLLALGVPCSAQLGVIFSLLTSIKALFIWGGVVFLVLVAVGFLAGQVLPGRGSDFILEVPPMRWPKMRNIAVKTLARSEWYIKEAVPLFVLGTLVLFTLDKLRVLGWLESAAAPVVTGLLGLPQQAARVFIMGFLRRDYGGAGLKTMWDANLLTHDQLLVSLITITLFVPCIANFFVMGKERGWKAAFGMVAFIVPLAVLVGTLVRLLLATDIL